MTRAFFDSNVLLYGFAFADPKAARAQELVGAGGVISVQCLNEFANVARRKLAMSWERVDEALAVITGLCEPAAALDIRIHRKGLSIAAHSRLSIYDSMIVASALVTGCDTLYSEDMHHGLVVDNQLRIVNPFDV
jgi:predicted nucleic acid-binding protein